MEQLFFWGREAHGSAPEMTSMAWRPLFDVRIMSDHRNNDDGDRLIIIISGLISATRKETSEADDTSTHQKSRGESAHAFER